MPSDILALDPATKTGFAHSTGPSGVWDLSCRRMIKGVGARLLRLQTFLDASLEDHGLDLVVYEQATWGLRGSAIRLAGSIEGTILLFCERENIPCEAVSPKVIKKHATGNGNAKKTIVLRAARERWPLQTIIDDNHADALWLLDFAKENL